MKISIITACYNAAAHIRTAMDSVLSQTWPEIEYIVVDGGSTDGTVEIIREYEEKCVSALVPDCVSENTDACADQQIRQSGNKALKKFVSSFVRECVSECSTAEGHERTRQFIWLSERDSGMYDAINKGIRMATGEVIGILNADDVLSDDRVIERVVETFGGKATAIIANGANGKVPRQDAKALREEEVSADGGRNSTGVNQANSSFILHPSSLSLDVVYGDIRFVANRTGTDLEAIRSERTVRYYSARHWRPWMLRWGFMPPHPSVYIRKACFERLGEYALDYRIAADYALLIRFLRKAKLRCRYVPMCFVDMRVGGMSTKNWRSNLLLNQEIVRGNREAGYFCCLPMLLPKYLFKVFEFLGPKMKNYRQ